jgi:hypothetical protein
MLNKNRGTTVLAPDRLFAVRKKGTPRAPISAHLPLLPSGPGGFSEMTPREGSESRVRARHCPLTKWLWVTSPTEDSPSGLWRSLGKRVGLTPSGVRIPYPPPEQALEKKGGPLGPPSSLD